MLARQKAEQRTSRPRVYIEEWDDPMITGIQYFSELVELCGGENIFKNLSFGNLAKDRFVDWGDVVAESPDIILACWCGKKVNLADFSQRDGSETIAAIRNNRVIELAPDIFLQPGPALFESGIEILTQIFDSF